MASMMGTIKVEQKPSRAKRSLFEVKKEAEVRKATEALEADMSSSQTLDSDVEWMEEICRMSEDDLDNDAVVTPPKRPRLATSVKASIKVVSPMKERRSPQKSQPKKRYVC